VNANTQPEVIEHELSLEEDNKEISQLQNKAISAQAVTPMHMLQMAQSQNAPVEQMERLWALNEKVEAANARKAYYVALAKFKENPPQVYKDKENSQYGGSGYVSIGNMVNTVSIELGKHELSTSWTFGETEDAKIVCTCIMSHALGHQESVTLNSPIDNSGSKNPLQGRKSTRTYLKLETFEAVTGMASVEGNLDDDGNSFSNKDTEPKTEALPYYPDADFQANKSAWFALFKENKSTPERVISKINSKYLLTDSQLKELRGEK